MRKPTRMSLSLGFLTPFSWILCSNHPTIELRRQSDLQRSAYTRIILQQRLSELRSLEFASCHEQMALAPVLDAWGRMIRCAEQGDHIILLSSGPDRSFNSQDDIEMGPLLHAPAQLAKEKRR